MKHDITRETTKFYKFASFCLDREQKVLFCDGKPVPLTPMIYDTLEVLIEDRGRLLTKDEMMQKLWPDRFVEETNLASNIKILRRALGDDAGNPRFIETVSRRGYRFIGDVTSLNRPLPLSEEKAVRPWRKHFALTALALSIAVFWVALMWIWGKGTFRSVQPHFTQLTAVGKVTNIALVPDGKSIVFSQKEDAGESLMLREIATGTQTQILPPQDAEFVGLAVSPAGDLVYYSTFTKNAAVQTLTRIPLHGGTPEQVSNIDTDVTVSFSPDGRRFAYTDTRASLKETMLKIADSDGSNQRVLIKAVGEDRVFPFFRSSPVAWSPDGSTLACVIQEKDENGLLYKILMVDPETGTERYLSDLSREHIDSIAWKDSENIAFIETSQNSPVRRIWQISTITGEKHPLTDSPNGYEWLSSAGGRLVTLQKNTYSSLQIADFDSGAHNLQAKQIFGEAGAIESVSWSRDNRILYNSFASGENEIWQINPDGTAPHQLTTGSHLIDSFAVSPADGSLVFSSISQGRISLSMTTAEGNNMRPLTNGTTDILPSFSPTGDKIVFQRGTSPPTLWSETIASEQLVQLTGYQATNPTFTPDGKDIAFHFMDYGQREPHWKLGLIDTNDHRLISKLEFPIPITQREAAWNMRTGFLTMAFRSGENSNLLLWSLTDGKFKTIDNIGVGRIGAFAWSPNEDRIVYSQVFETSDVVELDGF